MEQLEAVRIIRLLYNYCLKRDPEPDELGSWAIAAARGMPVSDIIESFGTCDEYRRANAVTPFWPPGHYYSPIVNPDAETRAYVQAQTARVGASPPGIDMMIGRMRTFFCRNGHFMAATKFPFDRSASHRFYTDNRVFPLADAVVLRAMINYLRPRRIIEIGSGFSTACMLDTFGELGLQTALLCIEPYPDRLRDLLRPGDPVDILEKAVQTVPVEMFTTLAAGDILFIDSTHVLKTGSDVHYELFEILPALAPGVFVHFHDLVYPFEYPAEWVFDENYSWNEAYAVRAFLTFNETFKPFYSNSLLAMHERPLIDALYPDFPANAGTSLWIKREQ